MIYTQRMRFGVLIIAGALIASAGLMVGEGQAAADVEDLPLDGWTITASDSETWLGTNGPTNVIDGDPGTVWESSLLARSAAHWIMVDTHIEQTLAGVSYIPRQDGNPIGRIGGYSIAVSRDGTTFSDVAWGTWADDASRKTAVFEPITARYVRLTALAEAGNRAPVAAAAEIRLQGLPNHAGGGSWGPLIPFPIVPVASAVIADNRLLTWSAYASDNYGNGHGYTVAATLDLNSGATAQQRISDTAHEMFCPGTARLPDGRLLVTGGSDPSRTSIFDPGENAWHAGSDMNIPRGYQAMATLANGQVLVLGGSWNGGRGGKTGEIWSENSGWRVLPGVPSEPIYTADPAGPYRADNQAWLFATGDSRVFHAGPSAAMHWIDTTDLGTITSAGVRGDAGDQMNGAAVLYDIGKILTVGGAPAYEQSPATAKAYAIDITGPEPRTTRLPDMAFPRAFANAVVLPTGEVLVVGGETYAVPFTDATGVLTPELWDPATGLFTKQAPMNVPRNYHSVANLLPDGRVFVGGGGLCGACGTNHRDGQIFTPAYLLESDGSPRPRPSIVSAPAIATTGGAITIETDRPASRFSLTRVGAATHSVDNDQRRIPLTITQTTGTTYQLAIPADKGVALPGDYLLFAIDAAGTPSVAASINIR